MDVQEEISIFEKWKGLGVPQNSNYKVVLFSLKMGIKKVKPNKILK